MYDSQLVKLMREALEDAMTKVPSEHATTATKAYLAECILKAAARGNTTYESFLAAACAQIADARALSGLVR